MSDVQFFQLQDEQGGVAIQLRKRTAYPGTYARQTGKGAVTLGYGDPAAGVQNEFLRVRMQGHAVYIERDAYCTLPLFYSFVGGVFICTNSYSDMLRHMPQLLLNKAGITETLARRVRWGRPVTEGVHVLHERETLRLENGTLSIQKPADRPWLLSAEALPSDPRAFLRVFDEHLDHFIDTRLRGQSVAFEVSGGLDSATLPQYAARKTDMSAYLASLSYPAATDFGKTQQQKLQELRQKTRYPLVSAQFDAVHAFPLSRMIVNDDYRPFYMEETTTDMVSQLAEQLRASGVTVLATGIGGDDMLENTVDAAGHIDHGEIGREERRKVHMPSFTTQQFYEDYVAHTPERPFRAHFYHAISNFGAQLARNNTYIERDIWPVSPFADPQLYTWCQGLPAHFRANKNILRAYHQSYGFVRSIYQPVQNEDFRGFFFEAWEAGVYETAMRQLLERSVTAALGYIDKERLWRSYRQLVTVQGDEESRMTILSDLYYWLTVEINLQHTPRLIVAVS